VICSEVSLCFIDPPQCQVSHERQQHTGAFARESFAALTHNCKLQHGLPSPGSGLGLAQQVQARPQPLAQPQLDLNHGSCHLVCKIPLYSMRDTTVHFACFVAQPTQIGKAYMQLKACGCAPVQVSCTDKLFIVLKSASVVLFRSSRCSSVNSSN